MPTLQQFRYLVAVADTLHFRRAAEKARVKQPTLSGQIQELEHRLGVQLVERSRSKVVLTPIGREVVARARAILRDVQDVIDLAKQGQAYLGGTVRMGVISSVGPYLLPHVLAELHQTYPELRLYVREGLADTLLDKLDNGDLDVLLFPLPVTGAELMTATICREPLWTVVPSDHRLAGAEFVARDDLAGETVLTLEPGHRLHQQVRDLCEEFNASLSLDYEGTSLDTLRSMVSMGAGISILPALYVRSEVLHDTAVAARQIRPRPPSRVIGLVWRKHSSRHDDFEALAERMRDALRQRVPEVTVLS